MKIDKIQIQNFKTFGNNPISFSFNNLTAKTDESDQAKPKQSDHLFCWRRFDVYNYSGSRFFS